MAHDRAHVVAVNVVRIVADAMRRSGGEAEARAAVEPVLREEIADIERQVRDELRPD